MTAKPQQPTDTVIPAKAGIHLGYKGEKRKDGFRIKCGMTREEKCHAHENEHPSFF